MAEQDNILNIEAVDELPEQQIEKPIKIKNYFHLND